MSLIGVLNIVGRRYILFNALNAAFIVAAVYGFYRRTYVLGVVSALIALAIAILGSVVDFGVSFLSARRVPPLFPISYVLFIMFANALGYMS